MGKVSIAAFSRYAAIGSAVALYLGGIAGIFYALPGQVIPANAHPGIPPNPIGLYGICVGIFIHAFEYPIWGIKYLGPINDILYIRGVFYVLVAGPACIIVPTTAGGFFIFISGWCYIWASIRGETWKDPFSSGGGEGGGEKKEGGDRGKGDRGKGKDESRGAGGMERNKVVESKPIFDPNKKNVQYDAQGYIIEDGPSRSAPAPSNPPTYSAANYSTPAPPPTSNRPKPAIKPKVNAPLPPAANNNAGYDNSGYDNSGYDASGYDTNGYDANGYNTSGYNSSGYR